MADITQYEIALAINGMQIAIARWGSYTPSEKMIEDVRAAYKEMVLAHAGLKQSKSKAASNGPYCKDHQLPLVMRSGKYGSFYSCPFRYDNGGYCKYRPPKA